MEEFGEERGSESEWKGVSGRREREKEKGMKRDKTVLFERGRERI